MGFYAPEIILGRDVWRDYGRSGGQLIEQPTVYRGEVLKEEDGRRYKVCLTKGNPEADSYCKPDSGCTKATHKLGYQSYCLKNCPFKECVLK